MGAQLKCSMGKAPSALVVTPVPRVMAEGVPAATVADHVPLVNILPFGMCDAPANPAVIAATAAAFGVHTPMPCVPVTPAPWMPGAPTVAYGGMLALDDASKCLCTWGGVVSVAQAATVRTAIP